MNEIKKEWSQSATHVTVSLFLDNCSQEDIELHWSDIDCKVTTKDGRSWSCVWYLEVDTASSKALRRGKYLKLKMSKAQQGREWKYLESGSASHLVKCEIYDIRHVHYVWSEDSDSVSVKVMVSKVKKDSVTVYWLTNSFILVFATSNSEFIAQYPAANEYRWTVNLRGAIDDANCSFCVDDYIQLRLTKAVLSTLWMSLENPEIQCHSCDQFVTSQSLTNSTSVGACNVIGVSASNDQDQRVTAKQNSSADYEGDKVEVEIFDSLTETAKSLSAMDQMVISDDSFVPEAESEAAHMVKANSQVLADKTFLQDDPVIEKLPKHPCTTGIKNLGYTCFLSSTVQCLAHCQELRDYILLHYYKADVNKTNPLGFKGELVERFSSVVQRLWSDEYKCISPHKLLRVFRSRVDYFADTAQHDAQEFMNFLLDGLHEDVNRIQTKPVVSAVEADGRSDQVVAEEAWLMHKKRNDSIISDLFQGQFKSTVCCPQCQNVSVTFDPFTQISVPLPKQHRVVKIIFMHQLETNMSRFYVQVQDDANVDQVLKLVAQKADLTDHSTLTVYEILNGLIHRTLARNTVVSKIQPGEQLIVTDVCNVESYEEPVTIWVYQTSTFCPIPKVCSSCKKKADETCTKLQRCGRCFQVAYCSKHCQSVHWNNGHSRLCGSNRKYFGFPFVFRLPSSQATYSQICSLCFKFARLSVSVTALNVDNGKFAENKVQLDKQFSLRPVNLYGEDIRQQPLTDQGNNQVVFKRCVFLAMEWQNNPKKSHSVVVKEREKMEFVVDENEKPETAEKLTLDQCLKLFTAPEQLTKTDSWYCSKCKEHTEAKKEIAIWRLPHILVLHLKRFKYSGNIWRDKITSFVDFPERGMNMEPYLADKRVLQKSKEYDLFGVVYHHGAVFGGHYVATSRLSSYNCEKLPEFYRYDDEIVEPLICSPVTRFAYVLFYRRKEDFHLSISNNLESPSSDDSTADRLYNTSCVSTSLEEERSTVSTVMEEQTHTPPPKRTIGLCETSTESSLNSRDASTDN
ncbi:ubiquitin carboxyl-terminal hydrolase 19-like isoform X2 [Corticium candelabrum]|uniref:ubiquitin carboxyl-terminal hydrolase 19-like isoform X2 n=1 Tax=Corticium candelabrum TaxID=121492 RepID=UPI002E259CEA|nr:ubiquitin carboxyl-terminal hydrolase 19-like isoform X2 [Corticium candelabrum]